MTHTIYRPQTQVALTASCQQTACSHWHAVCTKQPASCPVWSLSVIPICVVCLHEAISIMSNVVPTCDACLHKAIRILSNVMPVYALSACTKQSPKCLICCISVQCDHSPSISHCVQSVWLVVVLKIQSPGCDIIQRDGSKLKEAVFTF